MAKDGKDMQVAETICPICGHGGLGQVKQNGISLLRCADCQVKFQAPMPSAGYLSLQRDRHFQNAMTQAHAKEIKKAKTAANGIMRGYWTHALGRPAALNAFGKSVLEINCGLGFRLREFQKYGWTVYGIETSKKAIEYAKACALDANEAEGTGFARKYDLMVIWNGLGTLPNPKAVADKMREQLKADGLIYIHEIKTGAETMDGKQPFYYTQDAIGRLFTNSGFAVKEQGADDNGYFFWLVKQDEKTKGDDHGILENNSGEQQAEALDQTQLPVEDQTNAG